MNEKQRQSIDVCSDELLEILRPGLNDSFLPYLEYRRIITSGNRLAIEGKRSDFDKMRTLFDFLKVKDQGWQGLIGFLQHEGHQFLRDRLENLARGNSSSEDSFAANSYSGNSLIRTV